MLILLDSTNGTVIDDLILKLSATMYPCLTMDSSWHSSGSFMRLLVSSHHVELYEPLVRH